jgi:hypothetical protein
MSPQPVWDEVVVNMGATPINETHTIVTFVGNGTMTVPLSALLWVIIISHKYGKHFFM